MSEVLGQWWRAENNGCISCEKGQEYDNEESQKQQLLTKIWKQGIKVQFRSPWNQQWMLMRTKLQGAAQ